MDQPETTTKAPPEPQAVSEAPQTTSTSKKPSSNLPKLLIITLILITLITSAIAAYFFYHNQQLKPQNVTPDDNLVIDSNTTPTPTPILDIAQSPDPTANWNTYTNTKYSYSFSYPSNWLHAAHGGNQTPYQELSQSKLEGPYQNINTLEGTPRYSMDIKTSTNYQPENVSYFLDTQSSGEIILNNQTWNTYSLPNGYGDGWAASTDPVFGLQTEVNSTLFTITIYNQTQLDEIQKLIISTFEFSDESFQTNTDNWKAYNSSEYPLTFNYPPSLKPLQGKFLKEVAYDKCINSTDPDKDRLDYDHPCNQAPFIFSSYEKNPKEDYQQHIEPIKDFAYLDSFEDNQNRLWQVSIVLGEVYNVTAYSEINNALYRLTFQHTNNVEPEEVFSYFTPILSSVSINN